MKPGAVALFSEPGADTRLAPGPALGAQCVHELDTLAADLSARRQRGEDLLAPMSFRQLEALARRAADHHSAAVRQFLLGRIQAALGRHDTLVQQAQAKAQQLATQILASQPEQLREVRRLLAIGDLPALQALGRKRSTLHAGSDGSRSPLGALLTHLRDMQNLGTDGHANPALNDRSDMKSLRQFKMTWARMAAADDLRQALARAPQNAGPLNSHLLVLRSLRVMHEVSPDYLRRFMTHLDALLWLDQATHRPTAAEAKPTRSASSSGPKIAKHRSVQRTGKA